MSGSTSVLVVVVVLVAFYAWYGWRSRAQRVLDDRAPTVGLQPNETAVLRVPAERYFGPLVPGTDRRVAEWAKLVLRNVFSDPRLNGWRNVRHRGAPLELVVTDAGRVVVNIAVGWRDQRRPRAALEGREARHGFEPLAAWEAADRPEVLLASEVFPGRSLGRWVDPGRQRDGAGKQALAVIRSPGRSDELCAWMSEDAFRALVEWSVTGDVPDEVVDAQDPAVWTGGTAVPTTPLDGQQPTLAAKLLAQADAIEAAMREVGYWDVGPLRSDAMEFQRPFAGDTMAIEQWIQHVLLPEIRERARTGEPFPQSSSVSARYMREHDGDWDGPWERVQRELKVLDRLINDVNR